jgi:hypothetical protein
LLAAFFIGGLLPVKHSDIPSEGLGPPLNFQHGAGRRQRSRLLHAKLTVRRTKNNAGSLDDALLGRRGAHQMFKDGALARQEGDDGCVLWHRSRMIRNATESNGSQLQPHGTRIV